MNQTILKSVGILALLALFSGCAGFSQKAEPPLNDELTQWVLDSLRDRESRIQSVKGLFEASVSGSIIPISKDLNGVLFYERPYSMRLRGFAQFGGTIFEFRRDGDHYQLSIPAMGKAVQGQVGALNGSEDVSRVVALSLKTMDAILGKIDHKDGSNIQLFLDGDRFRLEIQGLMAAGRGAGEYYSSRVWINRDTFDVVQVEYMTEDEEIAMIVECSDFRGVKGEEPTPSAWVRLPFHIRAVDPRLLGGSLTLTFKELSANANSISS